MSRHAVPSGLLDIPLNGGRPVVVCFPPAGGSADSHRAWLAGLNADIVPVHLPGRLRRAGLAEVVDIIELAGLIGTEIEARLEGRDCVFTGHSMGAVVAYETARFLARSQRVRLLGLTVSGSPPPHLWHEVDDLAGADDTGLTQTLLRWGGTPRELFDEPELTELVLSSLRLDLEACRRYRCVAPQVLDIPVNALAGDQDEEAPVHEMADWSATTVDWRGLTVHPGGHFFVTRPGALSSAVRVLLPESGSSG